MKQIVVLGSTGSIGKQTLDVAQRYPDRFRVVGLSTNRQTSVLKEQIAATGAHVAVVGEEALAEEVRAALPGEGADVWWGEDGLIRLARLAEADMVVNGVVGSVGLKPTVACLQAGKTLCLSNKESLVIGGELVTGLAQAKQVPIVPIDSEHSAIFQCLTGERVSDVAKIIITGSGGPFRGKKAADLKSVTVEQALAHPRWKMGKKITIDSATLMNKGLEVIEAHFLFGVPYDVIEVVIHPESIVHSLVRFRDGSTMAQLAQPDMRLPIQYALTYPERLPSPVAAVELEQVSRLNFETPDRETFPCLEYSYQAGRAGKTYPAVLNAANEEAVAAFLAARIGFTEIAKTISLTLEAHRPLEPVDMAALEEAERWARAHARALIEKTEGR